MSDHPLPSHLSQSIEDAVLFGKWREIETILDDVQDDLAFPADLRNGLETLRYFREFYGAEEARLDETGRKQVALMDSAWSMDVLNKLRGKGETAMLRHA